MPGDAPLPPIAGTLALADLFVMRALGVRVETLALRFGLTEPQVRQLLDTFGEPARLQARRWSIDRTRRGVGATFTARSAGPE